MVGHLKPETKRTMRDIAIAVATRDTERMVKGYQDLGMILPGANLERIREAEAAVMERFYGKSMRELQSIDHREMHKFAREYRDLLYELPFQVPADLLFFGRCVAILSGMCTGLYPDFNLFEGLMPFAENILKDEDEDWSKIILAWLTEQGQFLVSLPKRVDNLLKSMERGEFVVMTKATPELKQRLERLDRGVNRVVAAVVFMAFLVTGALFYMNEEMILAVSFMGLSIVTLLWVLKR
jgi:predicted unusual protein kinase regulating ubiquinone biosynthesis (AarF/ABC1/UbiB family)